MRLILLAFMVYFTVELVRAFPWPERWQEQKPLSCLACLAFWSMLGVAFADGLAVKSEIYMAAAGAAHLMLRVSRALRSLDN